MPKPGRALRGHTDLHDARRSGRVQRIFVDRGHHNSRGDPVGRSGRGRCRRLHSRQPAGYRRYHEVAALVVLSTGLLAAVGARRSSAAGAPDVSLRNPLQLAAALQMAILFQAVLMAVHVIRDAWGQSGVFTSAAVLGLTDVDPLTVSMARGVAQTVSPAVAATAIAIGVLANTAMKLGLAVF